MSQDNRPIVIVQQVAGPKWNRGIAAVLSFLIPGLGQLYKGQIFSAIFWFCIVVAGYFAFAIPGIILHLMCIAFALMGNPNK